MTGIRVRPNIGIGDALQFSALPENYYRHTGKKLVDTHLHPQFDYNPYILRHVQEPLKEEINVWTRHCSFNKHPEWWPRRTCLQSSAEAAACILGVPVRLNRPRLYRFENFPFHQREHILLHVQGRSHGPMPQYIVEHVLAKYGSDLRLIGKPGEWVYPFSAPERIETSTFWDLAEVISKARMLIGVDSGPSWIAQCYPDIVVKKVRLIPPLEELEKRVPLELSCLNSYWDDRTAQTFNVSEDDLGFTQSYRRL